MTQNLIIWFTNGDTAKFESVKNFCEEDDEIFFMYHGISTNKIRQATFEKSNLAGWSVSDEEEINENGNHRAH